MQTDYRHQDIVRDTTPTTGGWILVTLIAVVAIILVALAVTGDGATTTESDGVTGTTVATTIPVDPTTVPTTLAP